MKLFKYTILEKLAIVILFSLSILNVDAQIYKYKQIDKAMDRNASDSLLATEFKAAAYFHIVINDYRKSKGKKPLEWSNALWLASRNHNLWMSENNRLNHAQNKKTTNFSGTSASDRLKYVTGELCDWSGENCLYYYPVDSENSTTEDAHQIVAEAFDIWKNSSGHNENMLANHFAHGTSFVMDTNGKLWGTTSFGYCSADPKMSSDNQFQFTVSQKFDDAISKKDSNSKALQPEYNNHAYPTNDKKKNNRINKIIPVILNSHIEAIGIKRRNYFDKAAFEHSTYLFHLGKETLLQERNNNGFYGKNTRVRIFKASMGRSIFLSKKKHIQEYTFYKEYDSLNFDPTQIETDLAFWIKSIDLTPFTLGGFGVKLGKKKKVTRLAVSIIVYP